MVDSAERSSSTVSPTVLTAEWGTCFCVVHAAVLQCGCAAHSRGRDEDRDEGGRLSRYAGH
jgi:hypothetical protein